MPPPYPFALLYTTMRITRTPAAYSACTAPPYESDLHDEAKGEGGLATTCHNEQRKVPRWNIKGRMHRRVAARH